MSVSDSKLLHLDRRSNTRVSHHFAARFVVNPDRPLRIANALTQDLGLRGAQMLTTVIPEISKPFPIWIPTENDGVICATARTAWTGIEDTLGDSPYWIKVGITLAYNTAFDRAAMADLVAKKTSFELAQRETDALKVGYIF